MRHSPALHSAVACGSLQTLPQNPQLAASVLTLISQALSFFLSQLAKPSTHSAPQTPVLHSPLMQSLGTTQGLSTPQGGQSPPQSMSVSLPFLVWSSQPGAAHLALSQTPLSQSVPLLQPWPVMHAL